MSSRPSVSPRWVVGVLIAATVMLVVRKSFDAGDRTGSWSTRGVVLLALTAIALFLGAYLWLTRRSRRE
jgi:hypothetical protein